MAGNTTSKFSSSWSGAFNAVKPISEKWFLRLGFSPLIDVRNKNEDFTDDNRIVESTRKNKTFGGSFSIGAEYHFATKGKLDPYIGMGSNFGFTLNKIISKNSTEFDRVNFQNEIGFDSDRTIKRAPTFIVSPFLVFGFNYFITPRFAVGAEYGFGPNFQFRKGEDKVSGTETILYNDGSELVTEIEENAPDITEFNTAFRQSVGFNFIYVLNSGRKE